MPLSFDLSVWIMLDWNAKRKITTICCILQRLRTKNINCEMVSVYGWIMATLVVMETVTDIKWK